MKKGARCLDCKDGTISVGSMIIKWKSTSSEHYALPFFMIEGNNTVSLLLQKKDKKYTKIV